MTLSLRYSPGLTAASPWGVALALVCRTTVNGMTDASPVSPAKRDHVTLIKAIAEQRDRDSFAVLFAHFAPRVKAWMMRAGSNAAAAEELAQETMLTVWQKAGLFEPGRASASTWIFTIARNQRIDALRRERHPSTLLPDPSEQPDAPAQADAALDVAEQEAHLRSALAMLPPEQAEVIRKAFFEDKVHSTVEKELGIPLGTVKSRLRLAILRLRGMLGDQG